MPRRGTCLSDVAAAVRAKCEAANSCRCTAIILRAERTCNNLGHQALYSKPLNTRSFDALNIIYSSAALELKPRCQGSSAAQGRRPGNNVAKSVDFWGKDCDIICRSVSRRISTNLQGSNHDFMGCPLALALSDGSRRPCLIFREKIFQHL
jgi:hypothetical protein